MLPAVSYLSSVSITRIRFDCLPWRLHIQENNCCERSSAQALTLAEITWALTTRSARTVDSFTFSQTASIVYQTGIRTLQPDHIISAPAIEVRYQSTDPGIPALYAQLFAETTTIATSPVSALGHESGVPLEGGAIAGIAIGLSAVSIAALVAGVLLVRKRHGRMRAQLAANRHESTESKTKRQPECIFEQILIAEMPSRHGRGEMTSARSIRELPGSSPVTSIRLVGSQEDPTSVLDREDEQINPIRRGIDERR